MRHSTTVLATAALLIAGACFGGSGAAKATPTPVPTATAFATVPAPVIVTPGASSAPVAAATPAAGTPVGAGGAEQTYTVAPGDSISVLADRFDVPSAAIRALNNLSGDNISVGQQLRIPARPGAPAAASTPGAAPGAPPTPAAPSTAGVTSYTVTPGDSALGIALKFDTTVEALERANGASAGGLDRIQIGQVLKLPPPGAR